LQALVDNVAKRGNIAFLDLEFSRLLDTADTITFPSILEVAVVVTVLLIKT
jgi:hypothetical protein